MTYVYVKDQELPAMTLAWSDKDGTIIDFSSGWTFTAKVALASSPGTVLLPKTTGITGAATSPNITIAWAAAAELSTLTSTDQGTAYVVWLYAHRTADSLDRVFNPSSPPTLVLKSAPA